MKKTIEVDSKMINNFFKKDFSGGCIETVRNLKTASNIRYRNIKLPDFNDKMTSSLRGSQKLKSDRLGSLESSRIGIFLKNQKK